MSDEGVVASFIGNEFVIATRHGICFANNREPIKLGDSVTFDRTNQQEPFSAWNCIPCAPLLHLKQSRDGDVLLKVNLLCVDRRVDGRRLFKTNFLPFVSGKPSWTDRQVNSYIGKWVYVKYIHTGNSYFWDIEEVHDKQNTSNEVIGFAYHEHSYNSSARVFVPGFPNDFLLRKSHDFKPVSVIGKWVKFTINQETCEVDQTKMISVTTDLPTYGGSIIKLPCYRQQNQFLTTFDAVVSDPGEKLPQLGHFHNKNLMLELRGNLPNRPNFIFCGDSNPQHTFQEPPRNFNTSRRNDQPRQTRPPAIANRGHQKPAVQVPSSGRPRFAPTPRSTHDYRDEPHHYEQPFNSPPRSPPRSPPQGRSPTNGSPQYHETTQHNNQFFSNGNNIQYQNAPRAPAPPSPPQNNIRRDECRRLSEQKEVELQQLISNLRQALQEEHFTNFVKDYNLNLFNQLVRLSGCEY